MYNPLVSVVIPCKNSAEFLWETLLSLQHQTYKNIEVIVVDNYSTDDTVEVALKFKARVFLKGPERATQDNYGIENAKGNLIWLTGSDMIADSDYIEQAVCKIKQGDDAIYASVLTDKRVKHYWGRVKALERECYIGDNIIESARFFKKSVWQELGGYDERLIQVEEDFQHRLDKAQYITARIKAREYHLHEETNLTDLFKKSRYYANYMGDYLQKHRSRGILQLNPFRNYGKFLKHPNLLGGLIIYKIVQYTGGLIGYLSKGDI